MGGATCVVVALSEDVRNIVAAELNSLGVETTLLSSAEALATTLEKIPASEILLEVITSIKASPHAKKPYRNCQSSIPLGNSGGPETKF
jgi:hypothetical protein